MSFEMAEKVATLRIAVVGCDYITNLGLGQLLRGAEFIEVVGAVPEAQDVLTIMLREPVDLVLLDAGSSKDALVKTCRELKSVENPPTLVVMGDLPFGESEALVFEGVSAVLHHGLVAQDLPVALRIIHKGGALFVSENASEVLLARGSSLDPAHRESFNSLNTRERVVVEGIAEGMTNGQLASSMHMSEATVKLLVSNIMNKFGVDNRVQIAVVATKARVA